LTTLTIIQFARKLFETFCHISKTIRPIDLSVNALCSAGCAAPTTLTIIQFARISAWNILSYLKNYWVNRPECQRVVLSRLRCAEYTVVSSICKNKFLNILSYLKNYWGNRLDCQRVVLNRLRCVDYTDNYSICNNKCLKHFVTSQKLLDQSTECQRVVLSMLRCAKFICCFFNLQE
jgi:hypothetical protein